MSGSSNHFWDSGTEQDFDTEFLDYILAVKVVDGVEEAVDHIGSS